MESGAVGRKQPLSQLVAPVTIYPQVLKNVLDVALPGGNAASGEVGLPIRRDGLVLPCGASGRWTPKSL